MPDETTPLLQEIGDSLAVPEHLAPNGADSAHDTRPNDVNAAETADPAKPSMSFIAMLIPLAVGVFFVAMDGTIVLSSYAAIGNELHELQSTSWLATSFMLTATAFQPLYGRLSDAFGRKSCILFAYTVFALGCLFCGLAPTMGTLVAARAFTGIGGGGMTTITSIIMSDMIPLRSRGTWQGIMNIVFAFGSAAGAPLGGIMADTIGWRWQVVITVPATVVAILVVSFGLTLAKPAEDNFWVKIKRIDFGGAATLVLAIFFLLFGLDRGGNVTWMDVLTVTSLALSAIFAITFGTIEARWARYPFAPTRIIANRSLIAAYLVNFFSFGAVMCNYFQVSLYLQASMSRTAGQSGALLLPSIAFGVSGSLIGGLLMQATGKYYVLTVTAYSIGFLGAFLVALCAGTVTQSLVAIVIGMCMLSYGNGTGVTSSLIALIANAGQEDQAVATALSYLFRSLGMVVGISVSSSLIQNNLRSYLREGLSNVDIDEIVRKVRESLTYLDELDGPTRDIVRQSYASAIRIAFWFQVGLAGCAAFAAIFVKEKPLPRR